MTTGLPAVALKPIEAYFVTGSRLNESDKRYLADNVRAPQRAAWLEDVEFKCVIFTTAC